MGKISTGQTLRSAERLLQVLGTFTLERPSRSIADIAAELRLAASTVRRLVTTLESYGYLHAEGASGRYRPHVQALRLAGVAVAGFDLIRAAAPVMDTLAEQTGEAIELTVRSGASAVVVSSRVSKALFRLVRPVGSTYPCYRGAAAGKVLLAWLDEPTLGPLLPPKGVWRGNVPQSITRTPDLLAALHDVRKQGYATNIAEREADVWVVAAPVRDYTNDVVAALGIPCLASRVPATERRRLTRMVCAAAKTLSQAAHLDT